MNNPFPYSSDNKRYHTLAYALRQKFGRRVMKAVIDAGFTCPNLDGTCGTGGCSYCVSGGSEFSVGSNLSISEQIILEQERIWKKWPGSDVIAYFQAHTNTYAPLSVLQPLFEEALHVDGVVGLSIATRCDCLEADTVDYLASLAKTTYLTVELGLQTIHQKTADQIGRGHDYAAFLSGFQRLKEKGIRVCVHLINGLPGESFADMLDSAKEIARLRPDAVKLHLLHIMEGSRMAQQYRQELIVPMSKEEYIKTVCAQLEVLPPETVIERITGDGSKDRLIAPRWSLDKISVLGSIDQYLTQHNTWQGKQYVKPL